MKNWVLLYSVANLKLVFCRLDSCWATIKLISFAKFMVIHLTNKNKIIPAFLLAVVICVTAFQSFKKNVPGKAPNIILIVADDLGYSDLASYGNKLIQTPNIDALGKEGIRFSQAYVTAPICGPSRIGLLTGRYQQRF